MTSSIISFSIIVLIVVFWFFILMKVTFIRIWKLKRADDNHQHGQPVDGTVIASSVKGPGKLKQTNVTVEFQNFAQTPITEDFKFVDTRPEENRYSVGKRVRLTLNEDAKGQPSVKLEGGKNVVGKLYLFISTILVAAYIYGAYSLYKFCESKVSGDWNNIEKLFEYNPAMPLLGLIFMGVLLFNYLLFGFIGKKISGNKGSDTKLKFHGVKAMATIVKYEDTNMMINNNPMVKFYYTFQDRFGTTHNGEDKKIVGKLEIGLLPTKKEIEIIYLPESPEESKLVENLKSNAIAGCMNIVVLFIAFIFSVVLICLFIGSMFIADVNNYSLHDGIPPGINLHQ